MPILIELGRNEMHDSATFGRNSEMFGIEFSSGTFSVPGSRPQDIKEPLCVGINFAPGDLSVSGHLVRAHTSFECLISKSEDHRESDLVVRFACVLVASYQLRETYRPSDSELAAFHRANVVFNCWPFFREFVQSCALRMDIPAPPIPFVRVQTRRSEKLAQTTPKRPTKKTRN